MARFLTLGGRPGFLGVLSFLAGLSVTLQAQTTMMSNNAEQANTPANAPAKPAAPTATTAPATTNAAPVVPPPDAMQKYGQIIAPSDQVLHPLRLKMPVPNIGEVHVPKTDEFNMRDKLEALASLSDADIRTQLEQWPAYSKMSLRDQGMMLQHIQDFRDYRTHVAMMKAHDMGLLTLTPDQKVQFEKEYWIKRLQMDRDIAKQIQPVIAQHEQKLQDELFREFSQASPGPMPPAKKPGMPPAPGAPPAKPETPGILAAAPTGNKPASAASAAKPGAPVNNSIASAPAAGSQPPH